MEEIYISFNNLTFLEELIIYRYLYLKIIYARFDGITKLKVLFFNEYKNLKDMPLEINKSIIFRRFRSK